MYRTENRRGTFRRPGLLAMLVVGWIWVPALSFAEPLESDGRAPTKAESTALWNELCSRRSKTPACRCNREKDGSQPKIPGVVTGEFASSDTEELLAEFHACDAVTSALFRRPPASNSEAERPWKLVDVYPETQTSNCRRFDLQESSDLLVCHRSIEGDTWRVGLFYSLDFAAGKLVRRQLTTYRDNARGCPKNKLRTAHPVGWRTWQVEGDPRPPLMTIFIQHHNGGVPDEFEDACDAMNHGEPVFGRKQRLAHYFELNGRRFAYSGSTRMTGDGGTTADWMSARRIEAPICRRQDVFGRVRQRTDALRRCYESALRADKSVSGTLKLRWTIGRNGEVEKTSVVEDELEDDNLTRCVSGIVEDFEFPPPRAGDTCTFVYPFRFAPD